MTRENFNSMMLGSLQYLLSNSLSKCEVIKKETYIKSYRIPDVEFKPFVGGMLFRDTKYGDGEIVERGDIVKVQYTGRLASGREIETTTSRPGNVVTFIAGGTEVVKAVSEGVIGMSEYGCRELLAPPSMHYPDKYPEQVMSYDLMVRTVVRKASSDSSNRNPS